MICGSGGRGGKKLDKLMQKITITVGIEMGDIKSDIVKLFF